jgi:tetratricopeptide (TPR) repeat protein
VPTEFPLEKTPVTIDGETYTIANVPDTSKLVLAARNRILADLKLDDFLSKLQLVGKLLFVAYNGVAREPELRGELSTLQMNYMRLCADSYEAMVAFDDSCTRMLDHLRRLFTYLLGGKEDLALLYLGQMQVADEMAEEALKLAQEFQDVFLQAKALAGVEVAKPAEGGKQQALEAKWVSVEALKQAVVILSKAGDWPKRMARHCKNLSSGAGGLKETIVLMKTDPDRLAFYQSQPFLEEAVIHYADWKALQMISKEYSVAAKKVKVDVQESFQKNLTTEEMLALAVQEGKALLASAKERVAKA